MPVYTIGVVDFQLLSATNLSDPHEWNIADTTDIIDNVALLTKANYG